MNINSQDNKNMFSDDGYIIDQEYTNAYQYGRLSSDINGCGWIAMYNLFHALNSIKSYEDIYQEMNAILTYKGMIGTPMKVMNKYLMINKIDFTVVSGKQSSLIKAKSSNIGIIRYFEGHELHFVTYLKLSNGYYRFFNAIAGKKVHQASMESFFNDHCKLPFVKVIIIDDHNKD